MAIFVSIVAYRDSPMLGFTMQRALETAADPDGLHFGIVNQDTDEPSAYPRNMSCVQIHPAQARGPCWARSIAQSFYRGEDWFLQIDSHMDFDDRWDERLIGEARRLAQGRKGVVLTTYPGAFTVDLASQKVNRLTKADIAIAIVVKSGAFAHDHSVLKFEAYPLEATDAVPGFHPGAGCLFAPGRFALEFPYDPQLYLDGEEQSLALRLFTHSWDMFHPVGMPIYHLYKDNPTGLGVEQPRHCDAEEDAARPIKWRDLEARAYQRFTDLAAGKPLGVYGLGRDRTLADFAEFSGIDYLQRTLGPRARVPRVPERNPRAPAAGPARPASGFRWYRLT